MPKKINLNITKNELYDKYITQNKRVIEIAEEYGVSRDTILRQLKIFDIKKDKSAAFLLTKESMIKSYGVDNPMKNKEIKMKAEDTCVKKYGATSILLSDEYLKNKKENIAQIKSTYTKTGVPFENYERFKTKESAIEYLTENHLIGCTIKELAEKTGYKYSSMVEIVKDLDLHDYLTILGSSSYYEDEISEYIKSLGITNIVKHTRKVLQNNHELDIYLPDFKLAIEFNGNYWHSDLCKEKNYHANKSKECETLGIRLIHIYQYEWDDARIQPILKSMLSIALGKVTTRIYARNCEIREITNSIAEPFNNKNHIQHHRHAQITYGLYYNNELVQLMSFSKHKKYEWEIIRGCPGSNNIVIGGVSRLFKHFIKMNDPNQIFSYCDFNKFDGSGYVAIGMTYIGLTAPDKTWIIDKKAVKRNPSKYTEYKAKAECAIYGAGSKKYLWAKKK